MMFLSKQNRNPIVAEHEQSRLISIGVMSDDQIIAELLDCILSLVGYQPVHVLPGSEQMCTEQNRSQTFVSADALILDIDRSFTRQFFERIERELSTHSSQLPCILLTTNPLQQERLERTGQTILLKPFKPVALIAKVQEALGNTAPAAASMAQQREALLKNNMSCGV